MTKPVLNFPTVGGSTGVWGDMLKSAIETTLDYADGKITADQAQAAITSAVATLQNGAPPTLNQMNELAAAINNDPAFGQNMSAALAALQPLSTDPVGAALTKLPNGTLGYRVNEPGYDVRRSGALCDGATDDTSAIADAVSKVSAAGGGLVQFPNGITRGVALLRDNTILAGTGRYTSTIAAVTGSNPDCVVGTVDGSQINWGARDITIDGRVAGNNPNTIGIHSTSTTLTTRNGINPRPTFENIYVIYTGGDGVRFDGDANGGGIYMRRVGCYNAGGNGFYIAVPDSSYESIDAGRSGKHGIYLTARCANSFFLGCNFWYSGNIDGVGAGWYLEGPKRLILSGCQAQDNKGVGFYLNGCYDNQLMGVTADSNGVNGAINAGFILSGSATTRNTIIGTALDRDAQDNPPWRTVNGVLQYQREGVHFSGGAANLAFRNRIIVQQSLPPGINGSPVVGYVNGTNDIDIITNAAGAVNFLDTQASRAAAGLAVIA